MEGLGQASWGWGVPSLGSPQPLGSLPSSPPPPPRCASLVHMLQPRVVLGSLSCSHQDKPSPTPTALLVGAGGVWLTPPASAYSFNFCLLLMGAQNSGLGSLGSPLESAAGGSFLPLPLPAPSFGGRSGHNRGLEALISFKMQPQGRARMYWSRTPRASVSLLAESDWSTR